MPKSKVRKKTVYTPPPGEGRSRTPVKVAGPTHPVYIAVMLGLMLLGLVWLVVNYIAGPEHRVDERAGLVELPHRLRAHRHRPADDDEMALTCRITSL